MLEFEKVVEFPKNPKEVSPENQFAPVPFTRADLLINILLVFYASGVELIRFWPVV